MAALPLVRGNSQVLYPFLRRVRFHTLINVSANGSEQRCAGRGVPLFEFVLTYNDLNVTDKNSINTFFTQRPGSFDSTWQMTVAGQTYSNLKFTDDTIRWTERNPGFYSTVLNVRQVKNPAWGIPTPGASFPNLQNGNLTQRPYGPEWRALNSVNDQDSGFAYAYNWLGGVGSFPTTAQRRWGLDNPIIQDPDVTIIENQFVGCLGRYGSFSVTDPDDSTVHPNCRFEDDVLEIRYHDFNRTEIQFSIIETNG